MNDILRKVAESGVGIVVREKGPRVGVVLGVAGMLGSGVHAVVKTPTFCEEYMELDTVGDKAKLLIKTYGPDVLVAVLSASAVIGFNEITNRRLAEMAAACEAWQISHSKLLELLEAHCSEEELEDILMDAHEEEVDGEVKKVTNANKIFEVQPFCRFFDESNRNWTSNPLYNKNFIIMELAHCQNMLDQRASSPNKTFTVNEWLQAFDYDPVSEGDAWGWEAGDVIDLGIYDFDEIEKRMFFNGTEPSILLRPNCKYIKHLKPRDADFLPGSLRKRLDGIVNID